MLQLVRARRFAHRCMARQHGGYIIADKYKTCCRAVERMSGSGKGTCCFVPASEKVERRKGWGHTINDSGGTFKDYEAEGRFKFEEKNAHLLHRSGLIVARGFREWQPFGRPSRRIHTRQRLSTRTGMSKTASYIGN